MGTRVDVLNGAAFVARPLGPRRLLLCGVPAYVAQHGVPATLTDLSRHALLHLQFAGREPPKKPQPRALPHLREGQLKTLPPDHVPGVWQLFIPYPRRKQLPARVRAFVDLCINHFGGPADSSAAVAPLSV